jgi:hypothetical protein
MADPLLTSLCAICHIGTLKYKCPRCNTRTCSLSCVKKHKAWTDCDGLRDPTVYIPSNKLRTPYGIDHDYNFISKIERGIERSEKIIVEEKKLVSKDDLRPVTLQSIQHRRRHDGKNHRVLVTEKLHEQSHRRFPPTMLRQLARSNIRVSRAPEGISRRKENATFFSKASGRVTWQIEWLLLPTNTSPAHIGGGNAEIVRILHKALDNIPLHRAFAASLAAHNSRQGKTTDVEGQSHPPKHKRRRKHGKREVSERSAVGQDQNSTSWATSSPSCIQDPKTGIWVRYSGPQIQIWPFDGDQAIRQAYQFYLPKERKHLGRSIPLIPLSNSESLESALRGTTILEFPTIYVAETSGEVPEGYVIEERHTEQLSKGKRKGVGLEKELLPRKRQHLDLEEGELHSIDDNSDLDEDQNRAEIVAEEVVGEMDSDEMTSSSGTDSESEP